MAQFLDFKEKALEDVAQLRASSTPGSHDHTVADSILRLREVEAVIRGAKETRNYARYTFWVALSTAATALGTLLVALFTSRGG